MAPVLSRASDRATARYLALKAFETYEGTNETGIEARKRHLLQDALFESEIDGKWKPIARFLENERTRSPRSTEYKQMLMTLYNGVHGLRGEDLEIAAQDTMIRYFDEFTSLARKTAHPSLETTTSKDDKALLAARALYNADFMGRDWKTAIDGYLRGKSLDIDDLNPRDRLVGAWITDNQKAWASMEFQEARQHLFHQLQFTDPQEATTDHLAAAYDLAQANMLNGAASWATFKATHGEPVPEHAKTANASPTYRM